MNTIQVTFNLRVDKQPDRDRCLEPEFHLFHYISTSHSLHHLNHTGKNHPVSSLEMASVSFLSLFEGFYDTQFIIRILYQIKSLMSSQFVELQQYCQVDELIKSTTCFSEPLIETCIHPFRHFSPYQRYLDILANLR